MRIMKLILTCMIVWFLCAAPAAVGDWDPGDPYKMHYPQKPDPEGWDVCVCCQYIADDFMCIESGSITDLHIWLSFKQDLVGDIDPRWADVSIWNDRQGKPGVRLWTWNGQGNITMRPYGQGRQGWICPSPPPLIIPNDHQNYFQVNITDIPEPFVQTMDTIYWLVIKVNLPPVEYVLGWKTSVDSPPGQLWGNPAKWSIDGLSWQSVDTGTVAPELHDMAFVITGVAQPPELEYGDAPEGSTAVAYPDTGVTGAFPTCRLIGPAGWIQHNNFGGWFGPGFDFELDGNAGLCPGLTGPPCFPPYDADECFQDGDAGLIIPEPYTIDAAINVVPCPQGNGTPLGIICTNAVWGQDIDIRVHNFMPNHPPFVPAYVNVLADWNQNGSWGGASPCPLGMTREWILQNFIIPPQYDGPLSALMPAGSAFLIGPNPGYVWFRFSITEVPITIQDWDGSGSFEDGETEDYLLRVDREVPPPKLEYGDAPEGTFAVAYPATGVTGAFPTCKNIGPAGWIQHTNFGGWFGPSFDLELDGNAGLCPPPGPVCFPPYDADECFQDGDAGLMFPEPYTIDAALNVVPCPQGNGTPLGIICNTAVWGQNIDIHVHNFMPGHDPYVPAYVNVLIDWDQNGSWGGASQCPVGAAPEHVLMNKVIPPQYDGPLSALNPPPFLIGPNPGYVWVRFSITEYPVPTPISGWNGEGQFEDGETEDYLLRVDREQPPPDMDFGDAPERPYPTTLASNGARHVIPPVITPPCLGNSVDTEADGQPDPAALGDDNAGIDDEDGVTFVTTPLIPGQAAAINVTANAAGFLWAWVDFAGDGSWAQPGDRIFSGVNIAAGNNALTFQVPLTATANISTFARFRFVTSFSIVSYDGQATDGEVEDYKVDIGENPDIKWVQSPDLTPNGINIKVDRLRHIADDFECKTFGPITDVHFWGSWKNDVIGQITSIRLAIYNNNPVGPQRYSEPNDLLWQREFQQGAFDFKEYVVYGADIGEWWWDPYTGELIPNGDRNIWQVDIYIDPCDAFIQKGNVYNPVIYWLHIQVTTEGGEFGWKTRRWPDHYMDDAVWDFGSELPRVWKELRYPPGHPYHGLELDSIDMAFVITGKEMEPPPKPPVEHLKWSQPPIEIDPESRTPIYCGWDEPSFCSVPMPPEPPFWKVVADDYRCLGTMPVSSIHWWGSYERWATAVAPPRVPDAWRIGFRSNVPADPTGNPPFSHPGELLWLIEVPASRVHEEWSGIDFFPQRFSDTCFQYYVQLKPEEYFWQNRFVDAARGDIFWVSIVATYHGPVPITFHPWGWKTRPAHWMDDAVTFQWQGNIRPGFVVPPTTVTPLEGPICQQPASVDVAFELDTHPNWIKWEQPFTGIRDWPHYEDEKSYAVEPPGARRTIIRQVADDWHCERTNPVTAAVWWGSHIGYNIQPCQCYLTIAPTPVDYFLLSIWTDVPANPDIPGSFSHPGRKLWEYKAYHYDKVLVGYDKHSAPSQPGQPAPYEPVYRYSVQIPEPNYFDQEKVSNIYWFSVVAVYTQPDAQILYPWGWTNHRHVFQDDAVAGYLSTEDPPVWIWEPLHDQTGDTEDMSFVLFTNACSTCLGDLDGNNWIMMNDMFTMIAALGLKGPPFIIPFGDPLWNPCADMDGNGYIMLSDLFALIAKLGMAGPPYIVPCP